MQLWIPNNNSKAEKNLHLVFITYLYLIFPKYSQIQCVHKLSTHSLNCVMFSYWISIIVFVLMATYLSLISWINNLLTLFFSSSKCCLLYSLPFSFAASTPNKISLLEHYVGSVYDIRIWSNIDNIFYSISNPINHKHQIQSRYVCACIEW